MDLSPGDFIRLTSIADVFVDDVAIPDGQSETGDRLRAALQEHERGFLQDSLDNFINRSECDFFAREHRIRRVADMFAYVAGRANLRDEAARVVHEDIAQGLTQEHFDRAGLPNFGALVMRARELRR